MRNAVTGLQSRAGAWRRACLRGDGEGSSLHPQQLTPLGDAGTSSCSSRSKALLEQALPARAIQTVGPAGEAGGRLLWWLLQQWL